MTGRLPCLVDQGVGLACFFHCTAFSRAAPILLAGPGELALFEGWQQQGRGIKAQGPTAYVPVGAAYPLPSKERVPACGDL